MGQNNNSRLDRGLDALNTVGSSIDLDAVQNTNTIDFTPRVSDMDTGGIGGGVLPPIVIDLEMGPECCQEKCSPSARDRKVAVFRFGKATTRENPDIVSYHV